MVAATSGTGTAATASPSMASASATTASVSASATMRAAAKATSATHMTHNNAAVASRDARVAHKSLRVIIKVNRGHVAVRRLVRFFDKAAWHHRLNQPRLNYRPFHA